MKEYDNFGKVIVRINRVNITIMSMKQYYGILSKALNELKHEFGRKDAWEMITEESGVYNVKDIAEGKIQPSIDSWEQLHKAFPDKIPPP